VVVREGVKAILADVAVSGVTRPAKEAVFFPKGLEKATDFAPQDPPDK
jgi:hypothetical protein